MNFEAFNTLHDGYISNISGKVPGDLRLEVHCEYLRERFSESGDTFLLKMKNCQEFTYSLYTGSDLGPEIKNLPEIQLLEPGFCRADLADNRVSITCDDGTILTRFESLEVWLNEKSIVKQSELEEVAKAYWEEFSKRSSKI